MDPRALLGLLVWAALTEVLFCVTSPCAVKYSITCSCDYVTLRNDMPLCEIASRRNSTYINCFNTCVIPNHAFETFRCPDCIVKLYLNFRNISVIQPDAFSALTGLLALYIQNNEIEELRPSTFYNVHNLTHLDISFNRLMSLNPDVFVHMKSFTFLNISHNMLVLNGTILNSERLNIIDAAYCNPMKDASWYVLTHNVFSGLPNLTKLSLEGNAIRCLTSTTFIHNTRLVELNFKNNMLKAIPYNISLCSHIISLYLSNNPLECDCHMKKLSEQCPSTRVKYDDVSCASPPGAWSLLTYLYCEEGTVAGSPDTANCASDEVPANTLTSAWIIPTGTSESFTTSAVLSKLLAVGTNSLYTDQQTVTSPASSSSEISDLTEPSTSATTDMPNIYSQNENFTSPDVPRTSLSMWCVFGATWFLVILIVSVAIFRGRRRKDFEVWKSATEYFSIYFFKSNMEIVDKVNENCRRSRYVELDSLQKVTRLKSDCHHLYNEISIPTSMACEVSGHGQSETDSRTISGILETDMDTFCTKMIPDEHVYEVVE